MTCSTACWEAIVVDGWKNLEIWRLFAVNWKVLNIEGFPAGLSAMKIKEASYIVVWLGHVLINEWQACSDGLCAGCWSNWLSIKSLRYQLETPTEDRHQLAILYAQTILDTRSSIALFLMCFLGYWWIKIAQLVESAERKKDHDNMFI